jgi:septal ring factor EnvC (AmiA/AmiB activator)
MKRLIAFITLVAVFSSGLFYAQSISSSDKEELIKIVKELKSLNDEQAMIIERSEKRNSELQNLSTEQKKTIQMLSQSSKTKQQIIDGQAKLIDELTSLSNEQKKSSTDNVVRNITIAVAVGAICFAGGCYAGIKIGR